MKIFTGIRYRALIAALSLLSLPLLAPAVAQAQTAVLVTPANGAMVYSNGPTTFSWNPVSGAKRYALLVSAVGYGQSEVVDISNTTNTSYTDSAILPVGTLYVQLWTVSSAGAWTNSESTFAVVAAPASTLTAPASGTTLYAGGTTGSTFSWTAVSGATRYALSLSAHAAGQSDVFGISNTTNLSTVVPGATLPVGTLYVRLSTYTPTAGWAYHDYTFTDVSAASALVSPANGGTASTTGATFSWTPAVDVLRYVLYVGTSVGAHNVVYLDPTLATSYTVSSLPAGTLFARLYTYSSVGGWAYSDSTFTVSTPSSGYWVPYVEVGTGAGGTATGIVGLGVVPSDLSSGTINTVVSGVLTPNDLLEQVTLSGMTVASYTPYAVSYTATGNDALVHLYGLTLGSIASAPAPVEIGGLATAILCSNPHLSYRNALTETSAFFLLQPQVSGSCTSSPTNPAVLVNWTDAPGAAVTVLPSNISVSNVTELYETSPTIGQLTGLVLVDDAGNLDFFAAGAGGAPQFTTATTIANGVLTIDHLGITINRSGTVRSTVLFDDVNSSKVYRIDSTGASTLVYTAAGSLQSGSFAYDDTNVYFTDIAAGTYNYWKAPIAGGAAVQIGSLNPPAGATYQTIDTNGALLIVELQNLGTSTYTLQTLSVTGLPTQTPNQLLQFNATGALQLRAFLEYSADHLFVNEVTLTGTSSVVFSPASATPLLGPTANTAFSQWLGGRIALDVDTVLYYSGLPTNQTDGGAVISQMSASTLTAMTPFTKGGSAFVVPASSNADIAADANTNGVGDLITTGGTTAIQGIAISLTPNALVTIPVASVNVEAF